MTLRNLVGPFLSRLRALDWVVVMACLAGPPLLYCTFRGVRFEDAYFFFQFARNLAGGHGYAFNPGEPVFGATSPLYTLLLTAVYLVSPHSMETQAIALNTLFVSVQALFFYLLLRDRLPWTGAVLALLTVLDGFALFRYLSMETPLYTALVLAALWAIVNRGAWWSGVLMGAAMLCRYDAIMLLPLHVAWSLAWRRRLGAGAVAIACGVLLPWLAFATLYFGSPLPHTLAAKAGVVPYAEYMFDSLDSFALLHAVAPNLPVLSATLGVVAGSVGLYVMRGPGLPLLPLVLYAFMQRVGYAVIGPPSNQTWHLHVSNVGLGALLVLGSVGALEHLVASRRRRWAGRLLPAAVGIAWLVVASFATVEHRRLVASDFWLGPRDAIHRHVAEWLLAHVKPSQRMMSTEVATVGYLSGCYMIDPFGLINATNDYPRTHKRRSHLELVRHYRPDVLLVDWPHHGVWLEQKTSYRMVKIFEWRNPFSTLLVASPNALADPASFAGLRAAALAASTGPSIRYRGE